MNRPCASCAGRGKCASERQKRIGGSFTMVAAQKLRITAKASSGRKAALGLRHIGLFEAPSPSSANYRAGGVMSLSGQRLAFCKR
jgi:hypothetical protein